LPFSFAPAYFSGGELQNGRQARCLDRKRHMVESIRKATFADADRLVLSLVRAFDDDPLINWILRQDGKRSRAFDLYFRTALCTITMPRGEVFATDDCVGGALWLPSDQAEIGLAQQLSLLPDMIRAVRLRGVKRLMDVLDAMNKAHPHERHYYLQFIGVEPAHQRKGLGSALMQPMLACCDREACGAYMENTQEKNLAFYEWLGFAVIGELDLGREAPPVWRMWRAPC
jgi:ribosomal protein S18 acetylase RimI-like enzyme